MLNLPVVLIGYSGHAYVVVGIIESMGKKMIGYCDQTEKEQNPFNLTYLGSETDTKTQECLWNNDYFICIGDNCIREKIFYSLVTRGGIKSPINAIHKISTIHRTVKIEEGGVMISAGVIINPLVHLEKGVICNTGCIIEHECRIGAFSHIAPGAVLCGNVQVGRQTFIGARSVIKQGVTIGDNVIIGAGSVVIKNVPSNCTLVGNPAKIIK